MITIRKSTHGFPSLSRDKYGAPLGGPSGRRSSAKKLHLNRSFCNNPGLELNKSKTEGMWLGSCRYNTSTPFGIAWPSEPIYALGIYFTYNEHITVKKNFEEKLNSMKKLLNLWQSRHLTLYGRIAILKSLALSKLVYNTSVLTFPLESASFVKTL